MSMIYKIGMTLIGVFAFTGCSSTIHRQFSIDDSPATSLSVDARQRVVLVTDRGGTKGNRRVVCAEPSPDVFSALAATFASEANVGEYGGELKAALSEQAAGIGERTQTVQLLRDGLFRACEAYLNGVIDGREYRQIMFGYDETMLTLLAIDGLTSRPSTPVSLSVAVPAEPSTDSENRLMRVNNPLPGAASPPATIDTDLAQEVHKILQSYYQFQLDLKVLFLEKKSADGESKQ